MADANKGKKILGSTAINVMLVFIIIIAVNIISASLFFRLDITQEQLYTLSDGTKNILEKVNTPTTVKYYYTKNLKSLPLTYKAYGKKIQELLEEYENQQPDQIALQTFDPQPDSDEEEWADKYGLNGIDLGTGERLYMGLVIVQEDREFNIPFLDPRREQFLEYDITQLFLQLRQKKDKVLGVMSTLPVMGGQPSQMQRMRGQNQPLPKWVFIQELEKTFEIKAISPNAGGIDPDISVLLVIHPKSLSEVTEYAIDQFVLRGGELVIMVDPMARSDQEGAMMAQMRQMPQVSSDLNRLFKHWGVEYKVDQMLGDQQRATRINAGKAAGVISYAFWQTITNDAFNQDLIATKELDNMLIGEPGGFTMTEDSPLSLQPIINSSQSAGLVMAAMAHFSDPLSINKELKPDGKTYTISGILTGKLTSAFDERPEEPVDETSDKEGNETSKPPVVYPPHIASSETSSKIFLIADVDFIADEFAVEKFNLLGQLIVQPKNDNLNFMVNMVEFLGGAEEMMAIRSRGRFTRPFTRFIELEQKAQEKYQVAENNLTTKLREVQQKLTQLDDQKGSDEYVLSKEQIDQITQFREEEKKTKGELRKIRKLLRQDIEAEKTTFTIVNLVIVPVLLVLFGLLLYYRRFHGRKS